MTNAPDVFLIGAGAMALAYQKVLDSLDIRPKVFGRGQTSAGLFEQETGIKPTTGDLKSQLAEHSADGVEAIVTVNAHALAETTTTLLHHGIKRILVEKPAALDQDEMDRLLATAQDQNAEVFVAYNRRFLSSVLAADRIIEDDGGVVSLRFDFSEPTKKISELGKPERELSTWFYGNSTHVIDLAFHFFGPPDALETRTSGAGEIRWHTSAGVFAGFGHRHDGTTIAWHSNWISPGRWGMDILTKDHRIILQPLEKLRVQTHQSFAETEIDLNDADDIQFKPGLAKQTRAFLEGVRAERLISLADHAQNMKFYEAIRTGSQYRRK